ncbi:hypothetical protein [Celeribacter sp.]|uniref:hypothetical protein n=1 Tax=Celeribacter sp. TaxID=1890673 RepID=UPI003A95194E
MTPPFSSVVKAAEFLSRPLAEARASTLFATTILLSCVVALNWLPMPVFLAAILAAVSFFAILVIIGSIIRLVVMGLHHLIDKRDAKRAAERQAEEAAVIKAEQEALLPTLIADMSSSHRVLVDLLMLAHYDGKFTTADIFKPESHTNHHDTHFVQYLLDMALVTNTPHPSYRHGIYRPTEKFIALYEERMQEEHPA